MSIQWDKLTGYFPEDDLEWKPIATSKKTGKALAAAYVTARAIQNRLDEVFGPGGWKNEYREGPSGGVICRIYFKNDDGEWVWREDGAENTDVESIKGGLSASLKRAGSALGIGRYLYDLPSQWVPVNEQGRFKNVPRVPKEFLPENNRPPREQEQEPEQYQEPHDTPAKKAAPAKSKAPRVEPGQDWDYTVPFLLSEATRLKFSRADVLASAGAHHGVTDLEELTQEQIQDLCHRMARKAKEAKEA